MHPLLPLVAAALLAPSLLGLPAAADTIAETEPNDTIAQANPLAGLGDLQATGSTSLSADLTINSVVTDPDFFRFFVTSPGNVNFTLVNKDGFFDDRFDLYDASGGVLFRGFPVFSSADLALAQGTYYALVVGSFYDPIRPVFSYHEDYTLDVHGQAANGVGAATVSGADVPEPGAGVLLALGALPLLGIAARRRDR